MKYPIKVLDKSGEFQASIGEFSLSVSLQAEQKGTHMSRFIEILNEVHGELTIRNLPGILRQIQRELHSEDAFLEVSFPYFITKSAPKSKARSLMDYPVSFTASLRGDQFDFLLGVQVPVKTLCPCSKAISEYGAHNQRCLVDVAIRSNEFVWIEDIVAEVEACASSPVFALLKREDEKYVTEVAYDNPMFVEDLVREVSMKFRALPSTSWVEVKAESIESIHNHSAFARIELSPTASESNREPLEQDEDHATSSSVSHVTKSPINFGAWLKSHRTRRNIGQQELASELGVSASFISRVEHGDRGVSRSLALQVSQSLGTTEEETLAAAGHIPEAWVTAIQSDLESFQAWLTSKNFPAN